MQVIAPLLSFFLAAPLAKTATVAKGETLAHVAARILGDEEAASELGALNGLAPGAAPAPGMKLKLPGAGRARAIDRIRRTQVSMRDANSEDGRKAAQAQLDRAYDALHSARYGEAEALAEEATRELAHPTTRLSVIVEPGSNQTRFLVQSGSVEITSAGTSTIATAGSSVKAGGGAAPRLLIQTPPPMPALVEPADGAAVDRATLRWSAEVPGAKYRVEVARDADFRRRVFSADVDAVSVVAPVDEGTWFWRVHAIGEEGAEGIPTLARTFVLKRPPKPEVNVGKPVFGTQERP